jgi:hypothetical protein
VKISSFHLIAAISENLMAAFFVESLVDSG